MKNADPLDRIEKTARKTAEAWGSNAYAHDVLALVEVARAARDMRDRDQTITFALRDALARLDKQAQP